MNIKYTEKLNQVLRYSREEAIRLQNNYIGPEHIMLGILRDGENEASRTLSSVCEVDLAALKESIEQEVKVTHGTASTDDSELALDSKSRSLLQLCVLESRLMRSNQIDVEHLLLAMLKQKNNIPATLLTAQNISYSQLYKAIKRRREEIKHEDIHTAEWKSQSPHRQHA